MKRIEAMLPPPEHTQVKLRCATCKKFPICSIRKDYVKTARLIQTILGAPAESYEVPPYPICIPDFEGTTIKNWKDYFPETLTTAKGKEAKFHAAKYQYKHCNCQSNYIHFIYLVDKQYYVIWTISYSDDDTELTIPVGKEIYYEMSCGLTEDDDYELLKLGLATLKEDIEDVESKTKKPEIINTTAFSAQLDCKYYEWEKGLTYEDGIQRMMMPPPEDDFAKFKHISTYHVEQEGVPNYYHYPAPPKFYPMPFYFEPPKKDCHCPPPHTRDEMNDF